MDENRCLKLTEIHLGGEKGNDLEECGHKDANGRDDVKYTQDKK